MRIAFEQAADREGVVCLQARLRPQAQAVRLAYRTRTGAVLRVDGCTAGGFDREHHEVILAPSAQTRTLTLEVEREALPTNGLPSGPGIIWTYLRARSHERPRTHAQVIPCHSAVSVKDAARWQNTERALPVIGHSHLDVAWLWTYEQTERKAQRTFAIACDLMARDDSFRFAQSQPQLYAFVEERDPDLFARVRENIAQGRFDPDVAALWVESDCNIPSGESLLRQMLHAYEYCTSRFAVVPRIAWLPDTFGFARTLPQLLAHAGIPYFATTKLQWNDTTRFPYPQFVWEGPDGNSVVAALIQSYDGPPYPWRVRTARERAEPLVVGYGDGGGGVTAKMLAQVPHIGVWVRPREWFEHIEQQSGALPVHRDELYLEYHRGVYTTHHDCKANNALLERALAEAEELAAWCIAVHAPAASTSEFAPALQRAWQLLLRNQFHDVLPGTSITPVYADVAREYASAGEQAACVIAAARSILPRASAAPTGTQSVEPDETADGFVFENARIRAVVAPSGAITQLAVAGGRNVCTQGNVLALYRDKPKAWEAWNIDRGYSRRMTRAKPGAARLENGALVVDFLLRDSPASMRVELRGDEPFVRVDLNVEWSERRTLLRVENWLTVQSDRALYGAPHGFVERSALDDTPERQAKFEVPGQRFAFVRDAQGSGLALFALDTYGWNARALKNGGMRLGHSLLRGTTWPDPHADLGEHRFAYAFVPVANCTIGELEHAWIRFAHEPAVRLFTAQDDGVLVVACKPAQNGDGVVTRVRECNGVHRQVLLRCGARMTAASSIDALERPADGDVAIDGESLRFSLRPYELRSFRVRFAHAR